MESFLEKVMLFCISAPLASFCLLITVGILDMTIMGIKNIIANIKR